jgi:hypothetical protein
VTRLGLLMTCAAGVLAVPATASADWGTTPVHIEKVTPNPQKGSLRVELSLPSSSYYKDNARLTLRATSVISGKRVVVADSSSSGTPSSGAYDVTPRRAALKTLKARLVLKTVLTVAFAPAGGKPASSHDSARTAFRILRYPLAECDASRSVTGVHEPKGENISVTVEYAGQGISCAHAPPIARAWARCALAPARSRGTCAKTVGGFRCRSSDLGDDSDSGAGGGIESQATITLTGKVSCKRPKHRTQVLFGFSREAPNPVAVRGCRNASVPYPGGSLSEFEQANTTCSAAVEVARAHTQCRLSHGRKGRCVVKVLGYSCREERTSGTTVEGTVTCQSALKRVRFTFRQT